MTNKIAVVIPCYKARETILNVIKDIPDLVHRIYCVDDGCPDNTGSLIEESAQDARVSVLYNSKNLGVGGAMVSGYKQACNENMDIVIKLDADGQMDPSLIPHFIAPILEGRADYTKGNRFYHPDWLEEMPIVRLMGNAILSFLSKISTGYWNIFDPNNGYTAIHGTILGLLPLDKINKGYFFETDMLFRLNTIRAVVLDIPQRAIYGGEKSHLKVFKEAPLFALHHLRIFSKRIFYNYYLRDFQFASIEWLLGPILLTFSLIFGLSKWTEAITSQEPATAGTVMLAALPFLVGLQMVLSALHFDIDMQPRTPVHSLIRKSDE